MRREAGMSVALVALCLLLWLSNSDFLGPSNLVNLLRQLSMLGIFAIGMGFVIISGGIDLSIGSVIGLTGVLIAKMSSPNAPGLGYPLWVGITRLRLQPFIVTLGGMLLLRGVSQTIVEGGTLSLGGSPLLRLANGGVLEVAGDPLLPYPLLLFAGVALLAGYVLHFTVFGRYLFALGGSREAAEYSGISVRGVETSSYVISSGLGGVAGVCYASYIGQMSQQVGIAYEMYAVAAAVLGGCSLRGGEGTILGIVIGSAMMRVIDNGINMFQLPYVDADGIARTWRLNPNWTFIIIGAVILLAVVLDQLVHLLHERRRLRRVSSALPNAGEPELASAAPGWFRLGPRRPRAPPG